MKEDLLKAENNPKVGDRLLVLEYKEEAMEKELGGLRNDVNLILTNHLPHIQDSVNALGEKISERFDKFDEKLEKKFVSQDRFGPIEKITYSLAGTILTTVILAIVYSVLK